MFWDDLTRGMVGEFVVFDALNKLPQIKQVIDVRDDKYFQSVDVDFLVQDRDRQFTWLEVKTDYKTFTTGNVIYEVSTSGNVGCLEKTKASVVAYYIPQSGNIYLCNTEALRRCVKNNDYRCCEMGQNGMAYIVPLGDLERYGVVKQTIKTDPLMKGDTDERTWND